MLDLLKQVVEQREFLSDEDIRLGNKVLLYIRFLEKRIFSFEIIFRQFFFIIFQLLPLWTVVPCRRFGTEGSDKNCLRCKIFVAVIKNFDHFLLLF